MNGERKFIIVAVCLGMFCITILYAFMFIALWHYRELIGLSLFLLLVFGAAMFFRGKFIEQDLRLIRVRHNEETPLDEHGEPRYWQQGYQANPHRK